MPNASLSNARERSRFRSWLAQDITSFRRLRAQFGFGPLRRADVAAKLGEDGALEDSLGRIYEPLPLPARGWNVVHFVTSRGGRMDPPEVDESVLVPQAGSLLRAYAAAEHAYQLDAISSAEEADGLARLASCDFDMEDPFGSPVAPPVDESPWLNSRAASEGWALFNEDEGICLERLDVPDEGEAVFATDWDAVQFVRAQAAAGSEYHAEALRRAAADVAEQEMDAREHETDLAFDAQRERAMR